MSQDKCYCVTSHENHRKVVHRPCSSYISSIQEIHENFIEFSLSSADKEVVGLILAQELAAILTNILFPQLLFHEFLYFLFFLSGH